MASITLVRTVSFSIYQRSKYVYSDWLRKNFGIDVLAHVNKQGTYPNLSSVACFGAAGATAGSCITLIACECALLLGQDTMCWSGSVLTLRRPFRAHEAECPGFGASSRQEELQPSRKPQNCRQLSEQRNVQDYGEYYPTPWSSWTLYRVQSTSAYVASHLVRSRSGLTDQYSERHAGHWHLLHDIREQQAALDDLWR